MSRVQVISKGLVDILSLENLPVAVKLLMNKDKIPAGLEHPETSLPSFCSAVVDASRGKSLYLEAKDMKCLDANIVLGLAETGTETNDEGKPSLGRVKGVVLSPLAVSDAQPDAVLMYIDPEQAGKLLQAVTYELRNKNGKKRIPTYAVGGEVLLCPAYVMSRAKLDAKPYVGVAGRWSNLNILTDKLVLGMPLSVLEKGYENLRKILPTPLTRVGKAESQKLE